MVNANHGLLDSLNRMKIILIARATGGSGRPEEYEALRRELLADKILDGLLPSYLRVCRTLDEFWSYIKAEYPTYEERRVFIRKGLETALTLLESQSNASYGIATKAPTEEPEVRQDSVTSKEKPDSIHPRCFITYTEADTDIEWIVYLGEKLTEKGIDVRLYEWDKHKRLNLPNYMEENINDAESILIICSPAYARRADNREAGVGYETTIITGEIYNSSAHGKVIPILRYGDPKSTVPSYAKSLKRVDMRDDDKFAEKLEELLRDILEIPLHQKPEIGETPNLISRFSKYSDSEPLSPVGNASPDSSSTAPPKTPRNGLDEAEMLVKKVRQMALSDRNEKFIQEALGSKWVVRRITSGTPLILLSIIPLNFDDYQKKYDFDEDSIKGMLQPLGSASWDTRIVKDGVLSFSPRGINSSVLFRNDGIIEAFDEQSMSSREMNGENAYKLKLLSIIETRQRILSRVARYLDALRLVGVDFPQEIFINLVGVGGFCAVELGFDARERPILDDRIDLESCTIGPNDDLETALRPAFDMLARSCGIQSYEHAKKLLNARFRAFP